MRDFIDKDNGECVPPRERNSFTLELSFGTPARDPSSVWSSNAWKVIDSTLVLNLESVNKKE